MAKTIAEVSEAVAIVIERLDGLRREVTSGVEHSSKNDDVERGEDQDGGSGRTTQRIEEGVGGSKSSAMVRVAFSCRRLDRWHLGLLGHLLVRFLIP